MKLLLFLWRTGVDTKKDRNKVKKKEKKENEFKPHDFLKKL